MLNYIKVGRLVSIRRGPHQGQLAIVVAILDARRVIIENPGVISRSVFNLNCLTPERFSISLTQNAPSRDLKKALEKKNVMAQYHKTGKAKRENATKALAESSEFERFQLRSALRSRAHWSRKIFAEKDATNKVSYDARKLARLEKRFENIKKRADANKAKA